MAERAASMVSSVRSMGTSRWSLAVDRWSLVVGQRPTTKCQRLSLNHFRHFEKCPIRIGSVFQRRFMGQRLAQAFTNIFTAGVAEALASLLRLVHTVAISHLCHGLHVCGVQFVEAVNVAKNRVQV